ncbi:MAG: hypothetical protein DCF25_05935 [Leptolyngbya foveolarum]|uniref:Uncharacterized protein n=1 Tax=Leptolyngbya foveolarum TaxID=47253 RepID=A0A2W4UNN0_9CYAN|nr:MAG: hypothetical protein DCF25_05935 [Leptolyngbya foveolarum]
MNFSLPPEVTVQSQVLNDGKIYQFHHPTLGLLGRIVLQDNPDGLCHISSEVAGDPNDPMTETRAQIFEPLSQQLCAAVEAALGKGRQTGAGKPNTGISPTAPKERIASQQIPCPKCGEIAALLIFANQAKEIAEMEDCARKTYSIYEELDVVTWIIGATVGTLKGDPIAPILRVWPQRHAIKYGSPKMFDAELNAILPRHCGGRLP